MEKMKSIISNKYGELFADTEENEDALYEAYPTVKRICGRLPKQDVKDEETEPVQCSFLWTGASYDHGYKAMEEYTKVKYSHYSGKSLKGVLPNTAR